MMADQAIYAEAEPDDFLNRISAGFTMAAMPETEDLLFPEDGERTLSIWDDVDWWTGEAQGAPEVKTVDRMTSTSEERDFAEETFAQMTPGSSGAFAAAEAATLPSRPTRRWFQQSNGEIPLDRLVRVGGNNYLRPDAAAAFRAMKRAAKKDGINITFSGAQSGYRDLATQHALFAEKGDSDTGGLAADPGTSNHGWGIAIDIGPEGRAWVAKNGTKYGFHQLPSESWHFDFEPSSDMEFALPRKRKPAQTRTVKTQGRQVGANDLSESIPLTANGLTQAILSLVDDDFEVETLRGKRRMNLSDIAKPKNQEEILAYARLVAKRHGWTDEQWRALHELGNRESGWDPKADNPTSSASGIPQRLLSSHPFGPGEAQKWKDPRYQIRWFVSYISQRYGDPLSALAHHDEAGWY